MPTKIKKVVKKSATKKESAPVVAMAAAAPVKKLVRPVKARADSSRAGAKVPSNLPTLSLAETIKPAPTKVTATMLAASNTPVKGLVQRPDMPVKPAIVTAVSPSVIKPAVIKPTVVKAATGIYPNTTQISKPVVAVAKASDGSILKTARAGFYLGLVTGVVMMSLLVMITYFSLLTNSYTLSLTDVAEASTYVK